MRVAKSKYSKKLRQYQDGGTTSGSQNKMMDFLNNPISKSGKGITGGGALGMGIDILSSFIPQKQADYIQGEGVASNAANNYNERIAKNQRTKGAISGGLSAAGNVAMMINPAVGLGLKAAGALAKAIPFGKGKEQEAMHEFRRMSAMQGQIDAQQEGARNYNAIAGFQAPAYGRHGMKFKTKYSKNVKF